MLLVRLMSSEADSRMMRNAARRWQTLARRRDGAGAQVAQQLQPTERQPETHSTLAEHRGLGMDCN